jgi:hypothetical protein
VWWDVTPWRTEIGLVVPIPFLRKLITDKAETSFRGNTGDCSCRAVA